LNNGGVLEVGEEQVHFTSPGLGVQNGHAVANRLADSIAGHLTPVFTHLQLDAHRDFFVLKHRNDVHLSDVFANVFASVCSA